MEDKIAVSEKVLPDLSVNKVSFYLVLYSNVINLTICSSYSSAWQNLVAIRK